MRGAQTLRSLEACRSLPILGKDGEAPLRALGLLLALNPDSDSQEVDASENIGKVLGNYEEGWGI